MICTAVVCVYYKKYIDLIEAMEVSLSLSMMYHSSLLQEIGLDVTSLGIEPVVILDVHILPLCECV